MKKAVKRNGTIEFMRFIFCAVVILYHINNRLLFEPGEHFGFFMNGRIGVEFFFLVSGWLMAKSAEKYENKPIMKSTKQFMIKKFTAILPYHLFIYTVCTVIMVELCRTEKTGDPFKMFISSLPNLFFLQKSGIYTVEVITPEWYIAAMLWMMLIIFPLILRFKDKFTKIACPIITVLLIGYMIHANKKLGGTNRFIFNGDIAKIYVRAFAEMCGGVFCYHVSMKIKKLNLTKADRIFLTVIEVIGYTAPVWYTVSLWKETYEAYAFYFLAVAVTLSFSGVTYLKKLFDNGLSMFLGKASLPLYMAQAVGFTVFLFSRHFDGVSKGVTAVFFAVSTVVFGIISYYVAQLSYKLIDKRFNLQSRNKMI